jgi:mutual gliding-motility protein MglA
MMPPVSTVNPAAREISAKIVYYGPGLSGKTTSLQRIHASVRPETRGQLVSLSTEGDRTLFFDFLPLEIAHVRGLTLRLQLYTVPGQVFYDATRKLVLNGADGVVFVADSQEAARDTNAESISNLETNLAELGIELGQFPHVLQYNKRDLPGALPVAELSAALNRHGVPEVETVASTGAGLFVALREITRLVVQDLRARQPARRTPPRPLELSGGGSELASQLSAAAEAAAPAERGAPAPASFSRLFPGDGAAITAAEHAVGRRAFGEAVRIAAAAVAAVLSGRPSGDGRAPATLGLEQRELLALSRLAAKADAAVTEQDALFALYVLVAAKVKAARA